MQSANNQAPIPQAAPLTRAVKFTRPFNWSPLGWNIQRQRPGDVVALPSKIADAALQADPPFGIEVKIEEVEEEVETKVEAKTQVAATRRTGGR